MTDSAAQPPYDPAQIPPIESPATPEPAPIELTMGSEPLPEPPTAPAPRVEPQAAPEPPPFKPPHTPAPTPAAPLPPPYSPPIEPQPAPFEPEPPIEPPPPPVPPYAGGPTNLPGAGEPARNSVWAAAAHLTSLAGLGLSCLLLGLIGPLIIWLAKKDDDPEADWHGRESLNFQLNMLILWIVAWPLYCLCCVGLLIHLLQPIYIITLVIVASIQAANGKRFRYPFVLRLLND